MRNGQLLWELGRSVGALCVLALLWGAWAHVAGDVLVRHMATGTRVDQQQQQRRQQRMAVSCCHAWTHYCLHTGTLTRPNTKL